MAISEDTEALVAARLTAVWAEKFLEKTLNGTDDIISAYKEFRSRVKSVEEEIEELNNPIQELDPEIERILQG